MSKVTRHYLKTRTLAELASLFNQIAQSLSGFSAPCRARDDALASLSMIRTEMSCRTHAPHSSFMPAP